MTKRTPHIIQAPSVPTILTVLFLNGRTMQVPINPVDSKMEVAPDGTIYRQVLATAAVQVPFAPMGITIVPHGQQWSSPDPCTVVARFPASPTETDMIVRHVDGSSETIRVQHPPGVNVVIGKAEPSPEAVRPELVGVVG